MKNFTSNGIEFLDFGDERWSGMVSESPRIMISLWRMTSNKPLFHFACDAAGIGSAVALNAATPEAAADFAYSAARDAASKICDAFIPKG